MAKKTIKRVKNYQLTVITHMLKLTTNAFGLVAALAWNNVIQEVVEAYIKPLIGGESGVISLLIYAVIVTLLAVGITLQLSKIKKSLEKASKNQRV